MSIRTLAMALLGAGALAGQPALAQNPQPEPPPAKNSGVGPLTTHPSQVDRGQNMILPSAGQSGPSAAPTMVYDCKNKPQDCTTPPGPGDQRDRPRQSTSPKQ